MGLAHHPEHDLAGLGVLLDAQARVLGAEATQCCGHLVLVGACEGLDRHRQQRCRHRPRPQYARAVGTGQGVAGLGAGESADRGDVTGDDARGRHLVLSERIGERADPLVLVVVLVTAGVGEERGEVTGHVYRRIRHQRAGEDPHDADPADVLVTAGAHHLGHQGAVGVTGHGSSARAVGPEGVLRGMLGRRREAPNDQVEQVGAAATVEGTDRDHRVQPGAGHRGLEVLDQQVLVDELAAEIAVHQRLVLGLLDHRLDEGAAPLVLGGTLVQQAGDGASIGYDDRYHPVAEGGPHGRERAVEVGPGVVQLADHHRPRHVDVGALAPEHPGVLVHGFVGRHDEQRAVGGPQPCADLTDEVDVAGGVEQVDLGARVHERREGQ